MKISTVHITNPSNKAGQEKDYRFNLSDFGEEPFEFNKSIDDPKKISGIWQKVEKWCRSNHVNPCEIRFGDPDEPMVESVFYPKPLG